MLLFKFSETLSKFQMRTKIFIVPAKDVRHVNLTFPIDDFCDFYAAAPDGFVAQLIGHKGPGGLFALLRKEGFAHHLVRLDSFRMKNDLSKSSLRHDWVP